MATRKKTGKKSSTRSKSKSGAKTSTGSSTKRGGSTATKKEVVRERKASRERAARQAKKVAVRMRPDGRGGLGWFAAAGWTIVGLILLASLVGDRWFTYGWPDSLWLFIGLGVLAASPAMGWVSQNAADVRFWALQGGLVSMFVLALTVNLGPPCPDGGPCSAVDAWGRYGLGTSIGMVLIATALSWYVGLVMLRTAEGRRPLGPPKMSRSLMMKGMLWPFVLLTVPVAGVLVSIDSALRPQPAWAQTAIREVQTFCFDDYRAQQSLAVRPDVDGVSTMHVGYLVRRTAESRPLPSNARVKLKVHTSAAPAAKPGPNTVTPAKSKGKKAQPAPTPAPQTKTKPGGPLPAYAGPWAKRSAVSPYEAAVGFNSQGEAVFISCRRIDPTSGRATNEDIKPPDYGAESPIKPRELLQAPSETPAPTTKSKKNKKTAKAGRKAAKKAAAK